jgi:hypothetical protein
MLFLHKNIRIAFSFISGNKLLAMNDGEQHSPFTHKGPQITPLSSLPLRGAVFSASLQGGRRSFSEGGRRGDLNDVL